MIVSRLSREAQTTVPAAVVEALGLREGDSIVYRIAGGRVVIAKAGAADWVDPFATFDEWASEADRKGYADL